MALSLLTFCHGKVTQCSMCRFRLFPRGWNKHSSEMKRLNDNFALLLTSCELCSHQLHMLGTVIKLFSACNYFQLSICRMACLIQKQVGELISLFLWKEQTKNKQYAHTYRMLLWIKSGCICQLFVFDIAACVINFCTDSCLLEAKDVTTPALKHLRFVVLNGIRELKRKCLDVAAEKRSELRK